MSNIKKTGVVVSKSFTESFGSLYDPTTYVEPDGSVWIRIVHHNNPASKLFNSTDDFTKPLYLDEDRWFNVAICNQITNNVYELMVKSKLESTSSELKYR